MDQASTVANGALTSVTSVEPGEASLYGCLLFANGEKSDIASSAAFPPLATDAELQRTTLFGAHMGTQAGRILLRTWERPLGRRV